MRWPIILIERIGRGRLAALVLIVLAAVSWQLARQSPPATAPPPVTGGERLPDFYVKGLQLTTTDAEGRPTRQLSAGELRYFRQDGSTELSDAHLRLPNDQGAPWEIRAAAGEVLEDGGLVLLHGPVSIHREATGDTRPLHLETRDLRLHPDEGYAETGERVTVVSGPDRIEAVGLQAWLHPPVRIKFLAKVKARYVPR